MLAIAFAVVSLLGWGIGDIFTTYSSRKMGAYSTSFYGYAIGAVLAGLYIPFALDLLKNFSLQMVLLSFLLAVVQVISFLSFNEGLKVGNSSLVGTIAGAFTSLVVIFSILFLGESPSANQLMAIFVILVGLVLSSINIADLRNRVSIFNRGTLLALVAMVGWGIYFTFIKIPVKEAGFFWPSYVASITGTLAFLIFGMRRLKTPQIIWQSGFPAIFISSILLTAGSFAFNFAVGEGLSSVVAPIAGAYPALFALLASIIYKDQINRQQRLGMVTTLVGVVSLAFLSS